MSQNTNLNVAPYNDDFSKDKNFHKVLFRPGYPVQARELTTLQSILQNQIENIGQHFFKDGGMIIPGQLSYDLQCHAILVQSTFLGAAVESYRNQLDEIELYGIKSGVSAKVQFSISAKESTKKFITLYVKYIASGQDNVTRRFDDNEELYANVDITIGGRLVEAGSPILKLIPKKSRYVGSCAYINSGVYFIRGFFVDVAIQRVLLDQYSNEPSYKIGFDISESIITPEDDESLNDNAFGSSNYNAPGAHRFRLRCTLTKRLLDDPGDKNFLELLRLEEGRVLRLNKREPFSELERSIARRTYDTHGDYMTKPFGIMVKESLNDGLNNGVFEEGDTTAQGNAPGDDLYTVEISPGRAYVQGYEISTDAPTYLDLQKSREVEKLTNQILPFEQGDYFLVKNLRGLPFISNSGVLANHYQTIEFYDSFYEDTFAEGRNMVGMARCIGIDRLGNNQFKLYVGDVQLFTLIKLQTAIDTNNELRPLLRQGDEITGDSSKAKGILAYDPDENILRVYQVAGQFIKGERLRRDGSLIAFRDDAENYKRSQNVTVQGVYNYDFSDVKRLNGTYISADQQLVEEFYCDTFLSDSFAVPSDKIQFVKEQEVVTPRTITVNCVQAEVVTTKSPAARVTLQRETVLLASQDSKRYKPNSFVRNTQNYSVTKTITPSTGNVTKSCDFVAGSSTLAVVSGGLTGIEVGNKVTGNGISNGTFVIATSTVGGVNVVDLNQAVFSSGNNVSVTFRESKCTVNSATSLAVGQRLIGSGIPNNTFIRSISGTTVFLTDAPTSNASVTATFIVATKFAKIIQKKTERVNIAILEDENNTNKKGKKVKKPVFRFFTKLVLEYCNHLGQTLSVPESGSFNVSDILFNVPAMSNNITRNGSLTNKNFMIVKGPYGANQRIRADFDYQFFTENKTSDDISTRRDTIRLFAHGLRTGDILEYQFLSGKYVGTRASTNNGHNFLQSGTQYYVIKVDNNLIRLATNLTNANAKRAIDITEQTYQGSGASYHAFKKVNSPSFKTNVISHASFNMDDQVFGPDFRGEIVGRPNDTVKKIKVFNGVLRPGQTIKTIRDHDRVFLAAQLLSSAGSSTSSTTIKVTSVEDLFENDVTSISPTSPELIRIAKEQLKVTGADWSVLTTQSPGSSRTLNPWVQGEPVELNLANGTDKVEVSRLFYNPGYFNSVVTLTGGVYLPRTVFSRSAEASVPLLFKNFEAETYTSTTSGSSKKFQFVEILGESKVTQISDTAIARYASELKYFGGNTNLTKTGYGTQGKYTIEVNNPSGILYGMLVTDNTGAVPANTFVETVVGNTVTISNPLLITMGSSSSQIDLTFSSYFQKIIAKKVGFSTTGLTGNVGFTTPGTRINSISGLPLGSGNTESWARGETVVLRKVNTDSQGNKQAIFIFARIEDEAGDYDDYVGSTFLVLEDFYRPEGEFRYAKSAKQATFASGDTVISLTGVSDLDTGDYVIGSGIPSNTSIISIDTTANTITLSAATTSAQNGTILRFEDTHNNGYDYVDNAYNTARDLTFRSSYKLPPTAGQENVTDASWEIFRPIDADCFRLANTTSGGTPLGHINAVSVQYNNVEENKNNLTAFRAVNLTKKVTHRGPGTIPGQHNGQFVGTEIRRMDATAKVVTVTIDDNSLPPETEVEAVIEGQRITGEVTATGNRNGRCFVTFTGNKEFEVSDDDNNNLFNLKVKRGGTVIKEIPDCASYESSEVVVGTRTQFLKDLRPGDYIFKGNQAIQVKRLVASAANQGIITEIDIVEDGDGYDPRRWKNIADYRLGKCGQNGMPVNISLLQTDPGMGGSTNDTFGFFGGGTSKKKQGNAILIVGSDGKLNEIRITDKGEGYTCPPTLKVPPPRETDGIQAVALAYAKEDALKNTVEGNFRFIVEPNLTDKLGKERQSIAPRLPFGTYTKIFRFRPKFFGRENGDLFTELARSPIRNTYDETFSIRKTYDSAVEESEEFPGRKKVTLTAPTGSQFETFTTDNYMAVLVDKIGVSNEYPLLNLITSSEIDNRSPIITFTSDRTKLTVDRIPPGIGGNKTITVFYTSGSSDVFSDSFYLNDANSRSAYTDIDEDIFPGMIVTAEGGESVLNSGTTIKKVSSVTVSLYELEITGGTVKADGNLKFTPGQEYTLDGENSDGSCKVIALTNKVSGTSYIIVELVRDSSKPTTSMSLIDNSGTAQNITSVSEVEGQRFKITLNNLAKQTVNQKINATPNNVTDIRVQTTIALNNASKKLKTSEKMRCLIVNNTFKTQKEANKFGLVVNETSSFFGTRVEDDVISLGVPDACKLHAVYESRDNNPPIPPYVILVDSRDYEVGSLIKGKSSLAQGRVIEVSGNKVSFVYLTDNKFSYGEIITGISSVDGLKTDGKISTTKNPVSVWNGSKDITSNYVLDNGQKGQFYDIARIVRKPGQVVPSRQIMVIFDHFQISGAGEFTTSNSYLDVKYQDIQNFQNIKLRDVIDFRPYVSRATTNPGTLSLPYNVDKKSLDFRNRDFTTGSSIVMDIPKVGTNFRCSYDYYLSRIDRLFLDPNGQFIIKKGKSSQFPLSPDVVDNAMFLATIQLDPYGFNVLDDVETVVEEHRRFTFKDIGAIEKRLSRVEYYTSLSLLEIATKDMKVVDADGFDRFKNGFVVDDFTSHDVSDLNHPDYNCSLDFVRQEMRASHYTTNVALAFNANSSSHFKQDGDILTLPYSNVIYCQQEFASRLENVNPFAVIGWVGVVVLNPESDDWVDIKRAPNKITKREGNFSSVSKALKVNRRGFAPLQWGAWETQWTGTSTTTKIERETSFRNFRPGRGRPINEIKTIATTATQGRTAVRTRVVPKVDTVNLGDKVLSTTSIPFMRSRNITFIGTKLKPRQRIYIFFDGKDVTNQCTPKIIEVIKNANENKKSNNVPFIIGEDVVGRISGCKFKVVAPNSAFPDNPYIGLTSGSDFTKLPGSYSGNLGFLNIDVDSAAKKALGNYKGNIIVGEQLVGQRSRSTAVVRDRRFITDPNGMVRGTFFIPNPNKKGNLQFATGTRTFRLTSSSTNSLVPSDVETSAQANFSATGIVERRQRQILQIRNARVVRDTVTDRRTVITSTRTEKRQIGWYDPIAESFVVSLEGGMFITKVDVYFFSKDDKIPVSMQLRTMENGYPTTTILPQSEVILNPNQVKLSADASVPTTFEFENPIYLNENQEYCFVLLSTATTYRCHISRMGDLDYQGRGITAQPYNGVLFKSQNASTWTADQYEDMKFQLYRAKFDISQTGEVVFNNAPLTIFNEGVENLVPDPIQTFDQRKEMELFGGSVGQNPNNYTIGANVVEFIMSNDGQTLLSTGAKGTVHSYDNGIVDNEDLSPTSGKRKLTISDLTGNFQVGVLAGKVTRRITSSKGKCTIKLDASFTSTIFTVGSLIFGKTSKSLGILERTYIESGFQYLILKNVWHSGSQPYTQGELIEVRTDIINVGSNFEASIVNVTNYVGYPTPNGDFDTESSFGDSRTLYVISQPIYDPELKRIRVYHSNHAMHGSNNTVVLSGVISEVSPTQLTEDIIVTAGKDSQGNNISFDIKVSDARTFHKFVNGIPISSSNPGFIKIDDEILAYQSISDDGRTITIKSGGRGIQGTPTGEHDVEDDVLCYNFDGVPLTDINKTHTEIANPAIDYYEIKINGVAFDGIKGGGENVFSTQNVQFDALTPQVQYISVPGTSIEATLNTISASSISSPTQTSFVNTGDYLNVIINETNYFDNPRMIASKINELTKLGGAPSLNLKMTLSSQLDNLSPQIDLDRSSLICTQSIINTPREINAVTGLYQVGTGLYEDFAETQPTGDKNEAVYISKLTKLESPSQVLKVMLNAWRKPGTRIKCLYKVIPVGSKLEATAVGWSYFNAGRGAQADVDVDGDRVGRINVTNTGENYNSRVSITFFGGLSNSSTSRHAKAEAVVNDGKITSIRVTDPGRGYIATPSIYISPDPTEGGKPDKDIPDDDYENFREYEYTAEGLNFDRFQVKIIMQSDNQAAVPLIKEFRSIAMAG